MKNTILLSIVFMQSLCANAQSVSVDEARSRAISFVQTEQSHNMPAHTVQPVGNDLQLAYTSHRPTDQKVCYYVFNKAENNGFVIVGGDESAEEILAYSDGGTFDYSRIPANFRWWLSQYDRQISYAIDNSTPEENASRKSARKIVNKKNAISAMLTTEWYQDSPYSDAIPGDTCCTGCVATAMAQIMKYHNYPATGAGSHAYTNKGATYSADFGSTAYDWTNMTDTYSSASTQQQKDAVATLMYHCGVSVEMNYGKDGSSASEYEVCKAFSTYFRYSKAVRYEQREFYTDSDWEDLIYKELANGRPVFYTGMTKSNGGHAFVCDGYRTVGNMFHMNWGWGSGWNCYCVLTGTDAVAPPNSDAFCNYQSATIGIIPEEGGTETPNIKDYADDLKLKDGSTEYKNYEYTHDPANYWGKDLTLTEMVWNQSTTLTNFTLGVKATETTTGDVYYLPYQDISLNRYGIEPVDIPFNVNSLPNGTFQIRAVTRLVSSTSDADWEEVGERASATIPTVTVTGSVNTVLRLADAPYFTDNIPWSGNMTLHLPLYNPDTTAVNSTIYTKLKELNSRISFVEDKDVSIAPGDTCDFTIDYSYYSINLESGKDVTFEIHFYQDENREVICNIPKCTYTYRPTASANAGTGFNAFVMPYQTAIPEGITVYTCTGVSDSILQLSQADEIKASTPYIIFNGTSGDITLKCPDITSSDSYVTDSIGLLTGLTKAAQIPAGAYTLQTKNGVQAFYRNTAMTRGKIHSCYLTIPESEASVIYLDHTATAISALTEPGTSRIAGIYTASGTRVPSLQPGLNIIRTSDGRSIKIMVK